MGRAGDVDALVRRADLDELMLEVDRLCATRDWETLVILRDRCEAAIELGHQLWGVARFAEYRLALEAPGPFAGGVCHVDASRFTLGPLTEVAASTHTWDELVDHLPSTLAAGSVAQERVLRGEDLRGDDRAHPEVLELPLALRPWEPDYPLPRYRSHDLLEGGPTPPEDAVAEPDPDPGPDRDADGAGVPPGHALERALRDVVTTWLDGSEGTCDVHVSEGDAASAASEVAAEAPVVGPIPTEVAVENLAWAAASGGAYGRRRGMAAARSTVFWVLRTALDLRDAEPAAIDDEIGRLRWFAIGGGTASGWRLRLALEEPGAGWAAAIVAHDDLEEGP